jgi:hypothetical protein
MIGICFTWSRKLKMIFVLIFIFISFDIKAQVEILNKNIGWRGDVELYSLKTNNPTQRVLFLFSEDSIRIMFFDRPENISKEFYISRFLFDNFLGASMKGNNIYLFVRHRKPLGIVTYVFNLEDEYINQYFMAFEGGDEKIIGSLGSGQHFVFLTANRKKSQFNLYDWHSLEFSDPLVIPFKNDKVWSHLTFSSTIAPETNIAKVFSEGESGDVIAAKPNKLYLIKDSVYFIMNNNDGVSYVYGFDLVTDSSFYQELVSNNMYKSADKSVRNNYADNSFLMDGRLYFVSVTYDNLDLSISDIKSGRILKNFTSTKSNTIPFKNTPIIQEGSSASPENAVTGSDASKETAQLFRKMVHSGVAVEAISDSGGIAVTIGSGKYVLTGEYDAPTTNGFLSSWEPRTTWSNSTHFSMLLNSNTLDQMKGIMQQGLNARIEKYLKGVDVPRNGKTVFNMEGVYYVAYYDSKKRSVLLVKFGQ